MSSVTPWSLCPPGASTIWDECDSPLFAISGYIFLDDNGEWAVTDDSLTTPDGFFSLVNGELMIVDVYSGLRAAFFDSELVVVQ